MRRPTGISINIHIFSSVDMIIVHFCVYMHTQIQPTAIPVKLIQGWHTLAPKSRYLWVRDGSRPQQTDYLIDPQRKVVGFFGIQTWEVDLPRCRTIDKPTPHWHWYVGLWHLLARSSSSCPSPYEFNRKEKNADRKRMYFWDLTIIDWYF